MRIIKEPSSLKLKLRLVCQDLINSLCVDNCGGHDRWRWLSGLNDFCDKWILCDFLCLFLPFQIELWISGKLNFSLPNRAENHSLNFKLNPNAPQIKIQNWFIFVIQQLNSNLGSFGDNYRCHFPYLLLLFRNFLIGFDDICCFGKRE